jgi:transcriptional regulator with XRE-family HTH domain
MRRIFFREWRKHRGLTLERAAERIDMSHANLSRIERGLQPYDEVILAALAGAYRCDPVDLLIRNPLDPDGIWSVWDQIEPERRSEAVELLKVLVSKRTAAI